MQSSTTAPSPQLVQLGQYRSLDDLLTTLRDEGCAIDPLAYRLVTHSHQGTANQLESVAFGQEAVSELLPIGQVDPFLGYRWLFSRGYRQLSLEAALEVCRTYQTPPSQAQLLITNPLVNPDDGSWNLLVLSNNGKGGLWLTNRVINTNPLRDDIHLVFQVPTE